MFIFVSGEKKLAKKLAITDKKVKMAKVIEIVANIAGKSTDRISPDKSLGSLGITSSIQILKIQSALERQYQQKLPFLADSWTVAKIATQVSETSPNRAITTTPKINIEETITQTRDVSLPTMSIGIDLEEVRNLPDTPNYRNHQFYQVLFKPAEIAYALLKNEPKIHLCGMFCAKEALKKAAPELINLRMAEIEITHQQGKPYITTSDRQINDRFNFQVSISHTQNYAVATVLAMTKGF